MVLMASADAGSRRTLANVTFGELPTEVHLAMLNALPGVVLLLSVSRNGDMTPEAANAEGRELLAASSPPLPEELSQAVARQLGTACAAEDVTLPSGSTLEVLVVPIRRERGGSTLVMCIGRDVSADRELSRAAETLSTELQRSNDDLQKFAYVASHDLSEPLRMVASFVELLGKRYSGQLDAKADEYIRFAVEGTQRMRALIEDLLAVATTKTAPRASAPVDLGCVVREVLDDLQQLIEQAGAHVDVAPLPTVAGDHTQLRQVMQNLLSNAMKFHTEPSVSIAVSASTEGERCTIFVDDDGIGVEAQHRERAFDMFTRLHPRSAFAGNGIGLGMAHRIVEAHNGVIWIEASPLGGARLALTLPLAQSEPNRTEEVT